MPIEVWSRFEKKKDGTVYKLRIQDLPHSCSDIVTDLMLRYYVREEPCQRAIGVAECPETPQMYADYLKESLSDPNFSCVICCSDDRDAVTDIMGVSAMFLTKEYTWDLDKKKDKLPKEWETYHAICEDLLVDYNPMEKHNLNTFYDDRGMLVVPEFRGLGIAEALLHARRIICAAKGVPMTGAWMSSIGTQIAAARDGWQTASEVRYEDLGKKHGVDFKEAPPTMKYMLARVIGNEDENVV